MLPHQSDAPLRATLLNGASSATGHAVARMLCRRGETVVAVSRSDGHLRLLAEQVPGVITLTGDMSNPDDVGRVREECGAAGIEVWRLVHLVGGWQGGRGITGQSDEAWNEMMRSLTALRLACRVFHDDLRRHAGGRLIFVSSPLAQKPTASSANYAAIKAAGEAWTLAVGADFSRNGDDAAASIIVTDDLNGREETFAALVERIFDAQSARVNERRIPHL